MTTEKYVLPEIDTAKIIRSYLNEFYWNHADKEGNFTLPESISTKIRIVQVAKMSTSWNLAQPSKPEPEKDVLEEKKYMSWDTATDVRDFGVCLAVSAFLCGAEKRAEVVFIKTKNILNGAIIPKEKLWHPCACHEIGVLSEVAEAFGATWSSELLYGVRCYLLAENYKARWGNREGYAEPREVSYSAFEKDRSKVLEHVLSRVHDFRKSP